MVHNPLSDVRGWRSALSSALCVVKDEIVYGVGQVDDRMSKDIVYLVKNEGYVMCIVYYCNDSFMCWDRCPVTGERMNLFMVHTVQGCLCAGTADVLSQVKG